MFTPPPFFYHFYSSLLHPKSTVSCLETWTNELLIDLMITVAERVIARQVLVVILDAVDRHGIVPLV